MNYPFTQAEFEAASEAWGCNCGPSALAFALQMTLDRVRTAIPDFEAKKYTSPSMMKASLQNLGHFYTSVAPTLSPSKTALVRVQWTGPWTDAGANPRWAYRQTHWVCCYPQKLETFVFDCNGGVMSLSQWEKDIAPILAKLSPRGYGGWFPTHTWIITGGAA